jgi:hypothetical protein
MFQKNRDLAQRLSIVTDAAIHFLALLAVYGIRFGFFAHDATHHGLAVYLQAGAALSTGSQIRNQKL